MPPIFLTTVGIASAFPPWRSMTASNSSISSMQLSSMSASNPVLVLICFTAMFQILRLRLMLRS